MRSKERGMSLAEVMVSVGIVAVLIFATITVTSGALTGTKNNADKQFATQKAISMLEELKALVQRNGPSGVVLLDNYDDGTSTRARLTTLGLLTDPPGDAISGNVNMGAGTWLYARQISVKPLADPNNPLLLVSSNDVRLVRVRVYKNDPSGPRLLAEVAGVIRTLNTTFPPSQAYDVYCIAVENVPGWWVNMSALRPFVQNAIGDLQNRNPGLVFRPHWITKLAYGRDTQYVPFINTTNPSTSPINSVYFYPGVMPTSYTLASTGSTGAFGNYTAGTAKNSAAGFYYDPSAFRGVFRDDSTASGVVRNGFVPANSPNANPYPYALADQYNNAMRYQQEKDLYQLRLNAVNASNLKIYPDEEPTLRLLLDDMIMNPNLYTNALVINLHGELLPFPPVRNYSDAAKLPTIYKTNGVRVVTHPEQLSYDTADASINLRVYAYLQNPTIGAAIPRVPPGGSGPASLPVRNEWLPEPITIILKGINWSPSGTASDSINAITGGVDFDPANYASPNACSPTCPPAPAAPSDARDYYQVITNPNNSASPAYTHMYYTRTLVGSDTVIKLWNTPLVAPCVPNAGDCTVNQQNGAGSGSGGIEHVTNGTNTRRLYGLEYIPAPLEDLAQNGNPTPFLTNLASLGRSEKNTARWILKIPSSAITDGSMVQIETRIGDYDPTTNKFSATPSVDAEYQETPNLSVTYTWRGSVAWRFGSGAQNANVPPSERYQFIGDPRHCPYADLKAPHAQNGATTWRINANNGMGYNRYFDNFNNTLDGDKSDPAALAANKLWPGWRYTIGSTTYGIKAAATPNVPNWGSYIGTSGACCSQTEIDVPRMYQMLRNSLLRANAVYTTMTGAPYYYIATGNEIGYDEDQDWPDNIPVSERPFKGIDPLTGTNFFEQSITPGRKWGDTVTADDANHSFGVKVITEADSSWWGMSWLGELYPDKMYDLGTPTSKDWKHLGNLPVPIPGTDTPTAANRYLRTRRDSIPANGATNATHTMGTTFAQTVRRTHEQGFPMFYWGGVPSGTAINRDDGATGARQTAGTEIMTNYNFSLDPTIPANRSFTMSGTNASFVDGLGQTAVYGSLLFAGNGSTNTVIRQYYQSNRATTTNASGLFAVYGGALNAPSTNAFFVTHNGLAPTGTTGTDFIAKWSLLTLVHGFLEAGLFNSGSAPATTQLPRVFITDPNSESDLTSPTTITVKWNYDWTRWDGRRYTNAYPALTCSSGSCTSSFSESSTLTYQAYYSTDNGATWRFIQDAPSTTSFSELGKRVPSKYINATQYDWSTPASSFPAGPYIVRVEAYRGATSLPLHYSFHQYQLFIKR